MTLVEYPDPQPVEVAIPVDHDRRGRVIGNEIRTVPGRYGSEWRCQDKAACVDRQLEDTASSRERAPW